jgi:hypothetical protein
MDFLTVIRYAWLAYDSTRPISRISDISAMVSTNHVYRIKLKDGETIIAKLSYFGKFEHFVEDHTIINILSNNLPVRYENFLSRALMKGNHLFVHRFQNDKIDAWVVFYRPIRIKNRLPRRLSDADIDNLAVEFANFHRAAHLVRHTLPPSSKTMTMDVNSLLDVVEVQFPQHADEIQRQSELFFENTHKINAGSFDKIPVFVDWNIGNFSVTATGKFFSRWDYDWFRMSSRMADFYFISRVVSDIGDRTVFTYHIDPMMEERFIRFLKGYHAVYPFSREEILFLKEVYRFFLLNYVIKEGKYFFLESFATKLQRDVFDTHFARLDAVFDADKLLKALDL